MKKYYAFLSFLMIILVIPIAIADYDMPLVLNVDISTYYMNLSDITAAVGEIPILSDGGWVGQEFDIFVNESGDTMTGDLDMGGNNITDVYYINVTELILGWGNLTGYDLDSPWTGLLNYGNITTCSDTEILKMSGGAWTCSVDAGGADTDTNASTACSGDEILTGGGSCLSLLTDWNYTYNVTYDANIDTDTNVTTACSDNEILDGVGTCLTLLTDWNITYNVTYDLYDQGNTTAQILAVVHTDTNASSICGADEVLTGGGSCLALLSDWNYTYNVTYDANIDTDTNVTTACADNEILDGAGNCLSLLTYWNVTYNATYDLYDQGNTTDEIFAAIDNATFYAHSREQLLWANITGAPVDTNASSICGADEFLSGDEGCVGYIDGWNRTDQGNTTAQILAIVPIDTNASSICSAGQFLDGGGACRSINDTIDNRTESVTYNASEITTTAGTLTDGDLDSVITPEDSDSYNVTEDIGAYPVLTIDVNFTNVTTFDTVIGRIWYEGGGGHIVQIEILRMDTGVWENYEEYTDMTDFVNVHFPVFDPQYHVDANNNVSLRFDHENSGLPNHYLRIDYIALVDGWTALTVSDHDALGGRDNKVNHPWAFPIDATRNVSGTANLTNLWIEGEIDGFNFIDGWNRTDQGNSTDEIFDAVDNATFWAHGREQLLWANITGAPVDTNASSICGADEILTGGGSCLALLTDWNYTYNATYDANINTDTNVTTACADNEILDGAGNCLELLTYWNVTYNATYDLYDQGNTTEQIFAAIDNATFYAHSRETLLWANITGAPVDTNASSICGEDELLSGDEGCIGYVAGWNRTDQGNSSAEMWAVIDNGTFHKYSIGGLNFSNITTCAEDQILKISGGVWWCSADATGAGEPDTNASTACSGDEILTGGGSCLAIDPPWNETTGNTTAEILAIVPIDTNASSICADNEVLDGAGNCLSLLSNWNTTYNVTYDSNIDTDTNASTGCGADEILTGGGSCLALLPDWNYTYNVTYDSNIDTDTNASTGCGEDELLSGDEGCIGYIDGWNRTDQGNTTAQILAIVPVDTNASSICSGDEILTGGGSCLGLETDWNYSTGNTSAEILAVVPVDTNASSICGEDELLSGDEGCIPYSDGWNRTDQGNTSAEILAVVPVDTNASSICSDNEILDGSGTCLELLTHWNVTYNVTYDANIDTDTNATTACSDNEILDGAGTCLSLLTDWNITYNVTYDLYDQGNTTEQIFAAIDNATFWAHGREQLLWANITGAPVDTNASSICGADEILTGGGSCLALLSDWNYTYNATYDLYDQGNTSDQMWAVIDNKTFFEITDGLLQTNITVNDDWDIGSYKLTAETFESDVATGTAPFIIASTTKVSNLNVDQLDSYDSAYFCPLNGTIDTDLNTTGALYVGDGANVTGPMNVSDDFNVTDGNLYIGTPNSAICLIGNCTANITWNGTNLIIYGGE